MLIEVERFKESDDWTLSSWWLDGEFLCFGLEDEYREVKVANETRIPRGTYEIKYRPPDQGKVNEKYAKQYGPMHKGMLWLQDVPGFEWIYIHVGNTDDHTSGCLLVGKSADTGAGTIGKSVDAYRKIYPLISNALDAGERVQIRLIRGTGHE